MNRLLSVALALLATMGLWATPEWWKSDEAGFPIERLGAAPTNPPADFWWFKEDSVDGVMEKNLYQGSLEKKKILVSAAKTPGHRIERTWQGATLVDETEYGSSGEMLGESAYSPDTPGELLWTESYEYTKGKLTKVSRSDAEGKETGSRSYRYDPDGRLLSVELGGYYGQVDVGTLGHGGLPQAFWQDAPDGTMRIELFDRLGNVASVSFIKEEKAYALQRFVYDKEGRLLSDSLDNVDEGTSVLSTYGNDGRLAARVTKKGDATIESREYQWDKAGDLIVETRSLPLPIVRIDRSWDDKGELLHEERRENGELLLVVNYEPNSVRVEETWAHGQLVVRTRFENGIKVLEEFFKDGVVVRTRNYR
ncbi:MAG TPA: hypothetical protein VMV83_07125 [Rectinemataceae bacterium]|nr:hypothetical protein [Rectinemataceae bacterium]